MYIGDYLARRELYTPDKLAVVDHGKTPELRLTYQQMNTRANQLGNWLQKHAGVGHYDRVAILARDGVEHLDTFFACAKLGAIHTALNWRLHWRETAQILEKTTPKLLIYSDDFKDVVIQINTQYPIPHLSLSEFDLIFQTSTVTPISFEPLEAEDIAALIFTGGTTGLPKAAQVSHRMIAWNTLNTVVHDLHHEDVYLNVFPLFHTGGLFVYTLPNIILGGTTILIHQFDSQLVLELLEKEHVTVFAAVPTMYQMLTQASNWEDADLSSLRFCTSGGAPLPVPLVEQYTREKGIAFKQGFGMTEFGPGIFALAPRDAIRKAGSIGRPNFFVEAQIVDDDGNPLGANEIGELVLKGPSYSSGYFNDSEACAEAVDENGFFHTGDLALYDEDLYFTIVDRKKDMFISGGENIYPAEIEKALYEHPAVHMCAIVGLPDPKWGEVGHACVVLKPGTTAAPEEILTHLSSRLANYKVPKGITFFDALPISGAGKILKRDLKEHLIINN